MGMDKPKKRNSSLLLSTVILFVAAGVLLSLSFIVFREDQTGNEELIERLQTREKQLGQFEEWFRGNFRMLLNDTRFNNILETFDLPDNTRERWQAIQQQYPPILNRIGESLSVMMSQILQLFNTQITTISTVLIDDRENLPEYTERLLRTQRIFVDMMSANLKIVSSRFFANSQLSEDLLFLSNSMINGIESLEAQTLPYLPDSKEKEIINTLLEASREWETRLNELLTADKQKTAIIAAIVPRINSRIEPTKPLEERETPLYRMTRLTITWVIPFILISTAFLLIYKYHNTNAEWLQMIKEKETAENDLKRRMEKEEQKKEGLRQTLDSEQKALKRDLLREKEKNEALKRELNSLKEKEKKTEKTEKAGNKERRLTEKLTEQENRIQKLERFKADVKALQTRLETAINGLSGIETENGHDRQTLDNQLNELLTQLDQTIDENEKIFSQTRLLSLNAAIESARAGEKGKGFGIVADKIRELSEKSQDTSTDLKESVDDILAIYNHTLQNNTEKKSRIDEKLDAFKETLNDINASLKKHFQ